MELRFEMFRSKGGSSAIVSLLLLLMPVVLQGAVEDPVRMYANDTSANLYIVDFQTYEAEWVGRTAKAFTDIAFNADGQLYGVNSFDLYGIDPATAATSWIGTVGIANGLWDSLVFDEAGTLWAAGKGGLLATIDPLTGVGTPFAKIDYTSAGDLAFDENGDMYLTTTSGLLVRIDTEDGTVAEIGELPYDDVFGFGRGPDGRMYGMRSSNELLSIDLTTGAATVLGTLTADFQIGGTNGGSFPTEAVPEPMTFLLLSVGGLMALRRRTARRLPL